MEIDDSSCGAMAKAASMSGTMLARIEAMNCRQDA
jgi:hypothetical protein